MTFIHIIAGLIAIAAGAMAMLARKGSPLHRQSGNLFTVAMLLMTGSAAIVSLFLRIDHITAVVALATAYLVLTGWLAVKRPVAQCRPLLGALAVAAALLGGYALHRWFEFVADPSSLITKNSPPQTLLVFAILCLWCALWDARLIYKGQLVGASRQLRHLWRMCVAMLIATGSLFAGQMQVFPALLRKASVVGVPLLLIPVLLVLLATLYWLVRTMASRPLRRT